MHVKEIETPRIMPLSPYNSEIYCFIPREDKGDGEGIAHTHPVP